MPNLSDWLSEVRTRLAQATPGPWKSHTIYESEWAAISPWAGDDEEQANKDAQLIAHAPDDLAYALTVIEAAEALAKATERRLDEWSPQSYSAVVDALAHWRHVLGVVE